MKQEGEGIVGAQGDRRGGGGGARDGENDIERENHGGGKVVEGEERGIVDVEGKVRQIGEGGRGGEEGRR